MRPIPAIAAIKAIASTGATIRVPTRDTGPHIRATASGSARLPPSRARSPHGEARSPGIDQLDLGSTQLSCSSNRLDRGLRSDRRATATQSSFAVPARFLQVILRSLESQSSPAGAVSRRGEVPREYEALPDPPSCFYPGHRHPTDGGRLVQRAAASFSSLQCARHGAPRRQRYVCDSPIGSTELRRVVCLVLQPEMIP